MTILERPPVRVGNLMMTVRAAPRTPENQERWERRSEALAAWLLAQWERQQQKWQREQLASIAARN